MALAALIMASEQVEGDEATLRAALPVAGVPLLERQAERAIGAGATRIFVMVSHLPQPVMAVIDRIKARGTEAIAVRTMAEVVARMAAEDRLLLVGDALHAAPGQYRAITEGAAPTILVAPDNQTTTAFERIDSTARWAGLALLPYGLLVAHADMPEEWDTASALVRAAVQAGARRVPCDPGLFERGEIAVVGDAGKATVVETMLLQNVRYAGGGMAQSLLFAPLARLVGPAVLRQQLPSAALLGGALVLILACLVLMVMDMPLAGALTGIVAAIVAALARFQMTLKRTSQSDRRLSQAFYIVLIAVPVVAAVALLLPWAGFSTVSALLLSVALSLSGLFVIARLFAGLEPDEDGQGNEMLLPDGETFLIAVAIAAAFSAAAYAFPVTLILAVGGIFLWLKRLLSRR